MMRDLLKQAAKVTNNSIILTIPLVLFILIIDLYSAFSKYTVDSMPKFFLASLTILFMSAVFCAGWFYMVKGAVELSKKVFVMDSDRARATLNLFRCIYDGVGKYFLSFVWAYVILFFVQILVIPVIYFLGVKLIGGLDEASLMHLQQLTSDPNIATNQGMADFINALTPEQIIFFGKWSVLFMLVTSFVMYLLMLWVPEIIYKTYNPLVALWCSLKKLFKDFVNSFRLFIALWFMGFALLFINTFAMFHPFSYLVMNIVLFYFYTYAVVLIFLYYDRRFNCDEA